MMRASTKLMAFSMFLMLSLLFAGGARGEEVVGAEQFLAQLSAEAQPCGAQDGGELELDDREPFPIGPVLSGCSCSLGVDSQGSTCSCSASGAGSSCESSGQGADKKCTCKDTTTTVCQIVDGKCRCTTT